MTLQASSFRVSQFSQTGGILAQLQRNLGVISKEQQQISSGKLHQQVSDAPLTVRRILTWERWVERHEKYEANISLATSRLSAAESSLDELHEMIGRARDLGLQQINGTATEETRSNAAIEIGALMDEALAVANRQFGDRFLFAGSQLDRAPFEQAGEYVAYRGDDQASRVEIGAGFVFEDAITGARAFGGVSAEIAGASDLNPTLSAETRLSDLNGGRGITPGSIEIRDGLGESMTIDLVGAKTVGDVMDRVNQSGFAVAAMKPSGDGILITKGGADLDIVDVNGGRTATDLGIQSLGGGATVIGGDLDPILRMTTPLESLRAGAGIDDSGITITNGNLTANLDFSGLRTVESVVNAINNSGTGTVAEIGNDGRSIAIRSTLAGADLVIEENGGTTGRDFGWVLASDEIPLERLNRGLGVEDKPGSDFRVTLSDGTEFEIDIENATTLGDIAELIAQHPDAAGKITAEVVADEDRLRLTDTAAGGGVLSVAPINGSYAATQLGIEGEANAGVIEGEDLEPGGARLVSAFDGFALLHRGLSTSDPIEIGRAIRALEDAEQSIVHVRAELGGNIRRLEVSARRTEFESLQMQEMVSLEGDTDLAEAIVLFQQHQTTYQAALQTASTLFQTSLLDFLR
ncbi:MAG: flagellar hook-associated protein FlgL [Planctomycetota bacterium]